MDSQPIVRNELRLPNEFTIPEGVLRDIQAGTKSLAERFKSPSRPDLVITLKRSGTMLYGTACKAALTANGIPLPSEVSSAIGTKTTDRYTASPEEIKDDPGRYMEWLGKLDQPTRQEIHALAEQIKKTAHVPKTICVIDDCSNDDITMGITAPFMVKAALKEAGLLDGDDTSALAKDPDLMVKTPDPNRPFRDLNMGSGITLERHLICGSPWLDRVRSANIPSSPQLGYSYMPIVMDRVFYELMKGTNDDGSPLTWEQVSGIGITTSDAMNNELRAASAPLCTDPVPVLEKKFGQQELMGIHTKLTSALQKVGLATSL